MFYARYIRCVSVILTVSLVVTFARPQTRPSLKITNHSFRYAAPSLCNELPAELREPHQLQSPSPSPPITHGSSSSSLSPLTSSLIRSVFHSDLKTWLFGKSFLPQTFPSSTELTPDS